MRTLHKLNPLMLVVIAAMILTACAAPAAPAADTAAEEPAEEMVTLRMTALGGIVAEAVTALTDNYMEENPNVEIIVDVQGDDMSWQKTAPTTMFRHLGRPRPFLVVVRPLRPVQRHDGRRTAGLA